MHAAVPAIILLAVGLDACSAEPEQSLEAALEAIIAQRPEATVAVCVRDAHTGTVIDIRADRPFHAASTMKIPVMIEAHRKAEAGVLSLKQPLKVINSFRSIVDGSLYSIEDDSDDAIYEILGQEMSIEDLLVQMITVSSNLATNLLIERLGADSVQGTVDRLGAPDMKVLRGVEDNKAFEVGMSNSTTARALAVLLERLLHGQAVSPTADSLMVNLLLQSQFNEMIPAGLPADARVAHKTGWITRIHHDAAIIYGASAEGYVLVILTEGMEDMATSAALGAAITSAVHARLRSSAPFH